MSTTAFIRLFIAVVLCATSVAVTAAAEEAPPDPIDELHSALLDTMRNAEALGPDGRYRKLEPVLRQVYDFERMITVAAGSHWGSASDSDRQALLEAFVRFSVANYASRFNAYGGEKFEITGERPGPRDTVLVDTRIVRSDGEPVPITYVMRRRDDRWRINDVLLERTISELAVRRSEFAQILSQGGPGRLAQVLNEKADAMLRQAA